MNKILLVFLALVAFGVFESTSKSSPGDTETVILSKSNTLVLNTEVDAESTSSVIAKAKELDAALDTRKERLLGNKTPLYLFLNTPGGSIQSGLEMIEALNGIGRKINTLTLFSASMGFQIAQQLGDRLILKNGVLMSHHAAGELQGSFGGVQPSQMDSRYQLWLDRVRELDEQTVKRTNGKQTYESYTKQYDHELWMTGTKSVAQGYADRIVLAKCDVSLSGATTKHANFMGFDIAYDLDNCPLNTGPMNVRVAQIDGKKLSAELESVVLDKFMAKFYNKQKQVIDMY